MSKRISMREARQIAIDNLKAAEGDRLESVNIESCDECDRLRAENQRLRSALESIVGRGTRKGPGAAVVVSMSTLVAIARQALEVSDE